MSKDLFKEHYLVKLLLKLLRLKEYHKISL